MSFSDIIGHTKQLESLRLALAAGRLHHAYLFLGPEGVGKRTVALSLAKSIHCDEAKNDFCGRCANCARIAGHNHPDVRLIKPLAGTKEISIQQIRDLEKELNFRSFSGKRKIVIIDPAALMNIPAQNALLKTLEEPPQDSLLILLAATGGNVLPTVRSRCLRIAFAPLPRERVADYLISKRGTSPEKARLLAAMSMGSLGTAVSLDDSALLEMRRGWIEALSSLGAGDYRSAINAAEALSADREESLQFLEWLESWYRDVLVYRITRDTAALINLDMLAQIEKHAAAHSLGKLLEVLRLAAGATARIQRNLNRRMIFEDILVTAVEEQ
jgi:DNA polymerase-3 subunit delta'